MSQEVNKNTNRRFLVISTILFSLLVIVVAGSFVIAVLAYFYFYYGFEGSVDNSQKEITSLSDRERNINNNDEKQNISKYYSNTVYEPRSDILDIINRSTPAVVTVIIKAPSSSFLDISNIQDLEKRQTLGYGTGFFISEDGILITNEHVVCGANAEDILIMTSDEKKYTVSSIAVDSAQDVAILRVNSEGHSFPSLKFANPETKIKVGQEVLAIGNPFGDNPGSVTRGIISGVGRNITAQGACSGIKQYEGVIQTDAAINSGNSGGPLLNLNGEVIGVNTATLQGANNISYTVPFTTVLRILDRYFKNGNRIIIPFLGVTHRMLDPNTAALNGVPAGALIYSVQPESPADKVGLKEGDIITKIGDYRVSFSLTSTLNLYFEPGQQTTIEVYRIPEEGEVSEGRYLKLNITIGSRESSRK